jgi:hypothetical protein
MTNAPPTAHQAPELADRPRELAYDRLTPGAWGYWPVLAAVPDDVRPGDRLHFAGDELGDVVAEVLTGADCRGWPCRLSIVTADGRRYTIGRMAREFRLDRWARHASLSRRGTR